MFKLRLNPFKLTLISKIWPKKWRRRFAPPSGKGYIFSKSSGGGGYFQNFSGQGGIPPYTPLFPILALISTNSMPLPSTNLATDATSSLVHMIVPPGDSTAMPSSSPLVTVLASATPIIELGDLGQEATMEEAQQDASEGFIDMNGLFEYYYPQVIEESDDEFNDWLNSFAANSTDQADEAQEEPNTTMEAHIDQALDPENPKSQQNAIHREEGAIDIDQVITTPPVNQ